MIQKEELLTALRKLSAEEELAIPIYTQHLESTFFLSGFKPGVQQKIKEILSVLAKESEGHARVFRQLAKEVEKSDQDVY